MQVDIPSVPIGGNVDIPAVYSYRIRFGQGRRLRVTRFELVSVIRVDGCSMSLYFPVTGYLNIIPRFCADIRIGNVIRKFFIGIYKIELPCSIQ